MTASAVRREHLGEALEVGTRERAVAADLGDDHGVHADVLEPRQHVEECLAGSIEPSPKGDLAMTRVEPDRHRLARGDPLDERRILERRGADDDPGDSRVRQRRGSRLAAHAAAGLHPRPARDRLARWQR